jgi:hypothetical protein
MTESYLAEVGTLATSSPSMLACRIASGGQELTGKRQPPSLATRGFINRGRGVV